MLLIQSGPVAFPGKSQVVKQIKSRCNAIDLTQLALGRRSGRVIRHFTTVTNVVWRLVQTGINEIFSF